MRYIVMMICAVGILFTSYAMDAAPASNTYAHFEIQSGTDRKEARRQRREQRRALRGEHKHHTRGSSYSKRESERIDRENYKQRKRMNRAAKKENRRSNWGTNDLGNVFGL